MTTSSVANDENFVQMHFRIGEMVLVSIVGTKLGLRYIFVTAVPQSVS